MMGGMNGSKGIPMSYKLYSQLNETDSYKKKVEKLKDYDIKNEILMLLSIENEPKPTTTEGGVDTNNNNNVNIIEASSCIAKASLQQIEKIILLLRTTGSSDELAAMKEEAMMTENINDTS